MYTFTTMELLYQYLWKYGLFGRRLPLRSGGEVRVVNPGILNLDAGPDFFNARLNFGDGIWAGNVEIHVKASDWYRHGHDNDPAYDNVLLHVVGVHDREVNRKNGTQIPTVEVRIPQEVCLTYAQLCNDRQGVRCRERLANIPEIEKIAWVETLAVERVQQKAGRVADLVRESGGDWAKAAFVTLARGLGFGLNAEPMEQLARTIDGNYMGRHSDNLMQLEAILFGQAGMLDPSILSSDPYYRLLCREYGFLSRKYGLRPVHREVWKYSRTRPMNFPHRRIAMLARAFYGGWHLMDKLVDTRGDIESIEALFGWELEGYWRTHSNFGAKEETGLPTVMGKGSRNLLIINVAVPLLYAYAAMRGEGELAEKTMSLLEELPAEKNGIMSQWRECGLKAGDALRSQALLHLRREYCDRNRCRDCRYAYALIREGNRACADNEV